MSIQAQARVMESSEARALDRLVLFVMANRAGGDHDECFASVERLAHECRVDTRTVQRAQRRLVESGDIVLVGVHPEYRTNIHRVMPLEARVAESHPPGTASTPLPPKQKKQGSKGSSVVTALRDSDVYAQEFDQTFWPSYPRKKSKGAAKKAYLTARKTTTAAVIAEGLDRVLPDWRRRPLDKVPYASSWLNAEGWLDECDEDSREAEIIRLMGEA